MGDLPRAIAKIVIGLAIAGLGWWFFSLYSDDWSIGRYLGIAVFWLLVGVGGIIALWGLIQLPGAIVNRFGKR